MGSAENVDGTTEPEGKGSRILVIDDEEVIHISLRRILGREGHDVDTAIRAPEGLEKLKAEAYDLVISDLMMPEMNGIQILEQVRELRIDVPVLMITGYPSIRTAVQALRLGAVDYLAKPFTRQELLGPVNRTLRGQAAEREEALAGAAPSPEANGFAEPSHEMEPGARFHLRKHAWVVYQQDGTMKVGIQPSFLSSVGDVVAIELPEEADLVEQGFTGIRLKTAADEEHGVFMPLSGQVVAVNADVLAQPADVTAETWLVQLLPMNLETELEMLLPG